MGRVQRRKQERQNRINGKINNTEEKQTGTKTLITTVKIIIVMALLLFVLYYILAVFVTKEIDISSKKDEDTTSTTDNSSNVSNKILAKNIFSQSEENYYVYFYDFNDENDQISSLISNIEGTVYRVDTSSGLNKNYITEENTGNKNAKDLENLKVINPTLIKITNDQITEYYENINQIVEYLNK